MRSAEHESISVSHNKTLCFSISREELNTDVPLYLFWTSSALFYFHPSTYLHQMFNLMSVREKWLFLKRSLLPCCSRHRCSRRRETTLSMEKQPLHHELKGCCGVHWWRKNIGCANIDCVHTHTRTHSVLEDKMLNRWLGAKQPFSLRVYPCSHESKWIG